MAIAAVFLLILPLAFGVRADPQVEEFLKTPGAVEKFTAKGSAGAKNEDESQKTPLVRQAADFAKYLNPPPPPPPPPTQAQGPAPSQPPPAPMGPVSAKFDLVATSFFASNPAMSLALIDQPGKGRYWVKQGGAVDHLTIDKITDGSITIKEGQRTSEMTVKSSKELWRGLLKNPPPETRPGQVSDVRMPNIPESPAVSPGEGSMTPARPETLPVGTKARSRAGARTQNLQPRQSQPAPGGNPGPAGSVVAGKVVPVSPNPAQPAQQDAASQSASPAQDAPASTSPAESQPSADDKQTGIDRIIKELSSSKITDDEAGKMEKLAEELKKLQESAPSTESSQQQPKSTGQPDTNSAEPNTPTEANN
jgi:hypothetical protein